MTTTNPSPTIVHKPAVGSNNVKSYGHADGVLEVEFRNGSRYRYTGPDVTKHFEALDKAQSKGGYIVTALRKCKTTVCVRLDEGKKS